MKQMDSLGTRQNGSCVRMIILIGFLAAAFFSSFCLGRYAVPLGETVRILLYSLGELLSRLIQTVIPDFTQRVPSVIPVSQTWDPRMENVILQIRLPRILLACLVGACLSGAGAAYQGVFQNPMASPDLLGAASGAAFGKAGQYPQAGHADPLPAR